MPQRFTSPRLEKLERTIGELREIADDLPDEVAAHEEETEEAYWCLLEAVNAARDATGQIETFERKEAKPR